MAEFKMPLSGDVTQSFPWTNYFTINLGQSSDAATEQEALTIASYGKQLGKMGEAVLVLLRHLPAIDKLPHEEQEAIREFRDMMRNIAKMKERRGSKFVLKP